MYKTFSTMHNVLILHFDFTILQYRCWIQYCQWVSHILFVWNDNWTCWWWLAERRCSRNDNVLRNYKISKFMSCCLRLLYLFTKSAKIYKICRKLKIWNHVTRLLILCSATVNMCWWALWTIKFSVVCSYIKKHQG